MKFNIGDRVQTISTKRRGTVVTTSGNLVAVELDDQTSGVRLIKFGISHGLLLEEANLEKIPSNKILITSDGKTTLARLYDGEKVIRTAEAKCSPRDTYDFATGANLAYDRLMRPAEPKKPVAEDKPRFKAGDKAKIIGNTKGRHCVGIGDIVNILNVGSYGAFVTPTPKDASWLSQQIAFCDLEPYTEPNAEPVKLYCVKSFKPGEWLTRGKTYDITDGYITYDKGFRSFWSGRNHFDEGAVCGVFCFPLVPRPAKAGEYIISTDSESGAYHEYFVLDGYDGRYEQKEPKCYNGAVVCIWSESEFFTVGKVYTYKDGIVNGDEMSAYNSGDPAKTKDDALNRARVHFIEFKGE